MRLTDKEMEIMAVLWSSVAPMTSSEIIGASDNRTWKESSIYIIMNTLLKKGAVALAQHKPTVTNFARAYKPIITSEEYAYLYINNVKQAGISIDIPALIERLKAKD